MYFSKKLSLLFIACPKTGSTSIESYLTDLEPNGHKFKIILDDREITSKEMHYGAIGHAHAWEFKKALGEEMYNQLHIFGMVRHPFDKLISSYFFSKSKPIAIAFKNKGKKHLLKRKLQTLISFITPKILPISIWSLLFPMKTCHDYFYDKEGNRIVKYLGRTDHINHDLDLILKEIGIITDLKIPHINKSNHKNRDHYFNNKLIRNYLNKKYERDIKLYQLVEEEMNKLKMKNQNQI
jgi:hypothetical protein